MPDFTSEATLAIAFWLGLTGSVHCIGMCGGIVSALSLGLPDNARRNPWRFSPYIFAYNAGRISSYTLAGVLAGVLGLQLETLIPQIQSYRIGMWLGGLFMIALGLYLAGWWRGLAILEKWGGRLWRHIEPFGKRLLPIKHPLHAFGVGVVWGWLPCGLVYTALVWALATGDPIRGGLLMMFFGLGTLPALIGLGAAARWLTNAIRQPVAHRVIGLLIIIFGAYMLIGKDHKHQHQHQHHHHDVGRHHITHYSSL